MSQAVVEMFTIVFCRTQPGDGNLAPTVHFEPCMMTRGQEHGIILDVQDNAPVGFPRLWTITGYVLLIGAAVFVGGIVYQETILTWTDGPQSLGFGNVHTGSFLFFILAAFVLLAGTSLWIVGSFVLLIRKKFQVPPCYSCRDPAHSLRELGTLICEHRAPRFPRKPFHA
jgi:hypothetical protein